MTRVRFDRVARIGVVAGILLAGASIAGAAQDTTSTGRSQADSGARTAPVTYVVGTTVYVAAGREEGLREGQTIWIRRRTGLAVTLKVAYLSSHQASCEIVGEPVTVQTGETVSFTPKTLTLAQDTVTRARRTRPRRLHGPGLHGRVGARYLVAEDALGGGFSQPSFDLRLEGTALGGTSLGLSTDLRTRRTTSTSGSGSSTVDGRTRVYQAALLWNPPGSRFRVTLGRQYLTAVTSVALFDGALVELTGKHFGVGTFGGVEPEPANLGFSREIQDLGGYLQLHSSSTGPTLWNVAIGAVGSYSSEATNREFGFAQAILNTPVVSLYALQELDYYRPWKVKQGENSLSLTSTYLNGSVRPARWIAFNAGFDNRRSVRLFRDAVNPATEFDDAYRRGVSGGVTLMGTRARISGDVRRSDGGSNGTATAWTGSFGLDRVTPLHLALNGRMTWYSNPSLDGRLYGLRVGGDPFPALHLELNGGLRDENTTSTAAQPATSHQQVVWLGADLDLSLARGWFLSLSATREREDAGSTTQFYGGLTWRF